MEVAKGVIIKPFSICNHSKMLSYLLDFWSCFHLSNCSGMRLDLVCMILPKQLESLTENFANLRSTSLCSTTSYRDSNSLTDDDQCEVASIEEDLNSGSDSLAHLPEYQHRAVHR